MAEAAFRQMIATCIRQTRPQSFRLGKPPRYPQQRCISNSAKAQAHEQTDSQQTQWRSHTLPVPDEKTVPGSRLSQLRDDTKPRSFSSFLTDNYSREHNYLRISVTERCNLRCLYCMPEEGVPLSPPAHVLTTPEIVYLSSLFVNQGVDKIRLTGGEPTVRKDIVDLMHQIGRLRKDGLKELCLTTNGISLHRKLDSMVEAGLTGVNLSLDTLDPFQFTVMTRRNGHEAVMKSIRRILEMNKLSAGIKLKVNCVVMRGINEREILPFVEMGQHQDLEVRFIEYMPFDGNKWSQNKMLPFQEMLAMIQERYPSVQKVQDYANDTSKTYQVPGFQGRFGFITSMTHNFCGTCNRLRITSDGNLKVCLFGNNEVSLRDILREANDGQPIDAEAMETIRQIEAEHRHSSQSKLNQPAQVSDREARLLEVIGMAVKRKKAKHAGMGKLENMKNRPMILIDGSKSPLDLVDCFSPSTPSQNNVFHGFQMSPPLRSIPLHLLSPRSPRFVSMPVSSSRSYPQRTISTHNVYRVVPSQGSFRKIPASDEDTSMVSEEDSTHEADEQEYHPHTSSAATDASIFANGENVETSALGKRPFVFDNVNHTKSATDTFAEHMGRQSVSAPGRQRLKRLPVEAPTLAHLTFDGEAHMVDISEKPSTRRAATARAVVHFSHEQTIQALTQATLRKGDALAVARVAAIQAAKKTSDLIPLAHPGLGLTGIKVKLKPFPPGSYKSMDNEAQYGGVEIRCGVYCEGKTGVEMEALTAATVAALTIFDMLKGVDKGMTINSARVVRKEGGKGGDWKYDFQTDKTISLSEFRDQVEAPNQMANQQSRQDSTDWESSTGSEDDKQEEMDVQPGSRPDYRYITNWTDGAWAKLSREEKLSMAWKTIRIREHKVKLEKAQLDRKREALLADEQKMRLMEKDTQEGIVESIVAQTDSSGDAISEPGQAPPEQVFLKNGKEKKAGTKLDEDNDATVVDDMEKPNGASSPSPSSTSDPSTPSDTHQTTDTTAKTTTSHKNQNQGLGTYAPPTAVQFSRENMSGSFRDRANSDDFYTKRMERWEDWASKR